MPEYITESFFYTIPGFDIGLIVYNRFFLNFRKRICSYKHIRENKIKTEMHTGQCNQKSCGSMAQDGRRKKRCGADARRKLQNIPGHQLGDDSTGSRTGKSSYGAGKK